MFKKRKKQYLNKIAELPLLYWWNVQETNNFIWLKVDADHEETDHSEEALNVYNSLSKQILEKYGVSDEYLKVLKKKQRWLIMANDALSTGDKHKLWKANILKADIDKQVTEETTAKKEDSLVIIHKFVGGGPINPLNITVDQYYYYMDFVNRSMKQEKQTNALING